MEDKKSPEEVRKYPALYDKNYKGYMEKNGYYYYAKRDHESKIPLHKITFPKILFFYDTLFQFFAALFFGNKCVKRYLKFFNYFFVIHYF